MSNDAIDTWRAQPTGKRGAQPKFSDLAIETALTLRLVFHLPLRQTEGFLTGIFKMLGVRLEVPDHTTLSRRSQGLDVTLRRVPTNKRIHLVIDSSGLSVVGEGEWAAAKHGGKGKRGWKKLHVGVNEMGVIVAQVLTDSSGDDARTGLKLIESVDGNISRLTADAAYDTVAIYDAAGARGAKVVVPPARDAVASGRGPRAPSRDRTIRKVKKIGRRRWKKESGYHRQGTVGNAFFRFKSIIGVRLRVRHAKAQKTETLIACNILNQMFELARPASLVIGP